VALAAPAAGCGGGDAAPPPVLKVEVPGTTLATGDATAFAVGDGRVVTVAHVLRAGRPVYVAGRRARVLRVDRQLDLALLGVRGVHGAAVGGGSVRPGERAAVRVLRAGAPRSLPATVRRPISARLTDRTGRVAVRPAIELAAAVIPGDSGAPVVDGDGHVVGMVFAHASDGTTLTYALDARALGALLAPRE
jgi:S1-C subfamily serine protease